MLGSDVVWGKILKSCLVFSQGKNKLAFYHCFSLRGLSDCWSSCQRGVLWREQHGDWALRSCPSSSCSMLHPSVCLSTGPLVAFLFCGFCWVTNYKLTCASVGFLCCVWSGSASDWVLTGGELVLRMECIIPRRHRWAHTWAEQTHNNEDRRGCVTRKSFTQWW